MHTHPLPHTIAACAALLFAAVPASGEITITSERRASALPTNGTFVFTNVPSNSSTDLANGKLFTVLAGTPYEANSVANLTNGPAQTNQDSVPESFFTSGTGNIRVQIDLGGAFQLQQINSYSWHANARAPQLYKVYGAASPVNSSPDFTQAEFQNDAALSVLGYTLIADVKTEMISGGQYGVSIAGEIGTYRYLLFDMAPPVWGVGPRPTFYGEIDIYGEPAAAPFQLTITPAAEPATGYVLEWESQPRKLYNLRTSTDLVGADLHLGVGGRRY